MKLFKNLFFYRIGAGFVFDLGASEQKLAACEFHPCGATQQKAIGWTPPREVNGAMIESIGWHWIAKLTTEVKTVPAQALSRRVDELADQILKTTGRKPGKKERKELKEQALLELLPMAFPRTFSSLVWIDPEARMLVIEASGIAKADDVATALVKTIPTMEVQQLQTQASPAGCMAAWLTDGEPPALFTIDRECSLVSCDEQRSMVKYGRHRLDTEDVRQHILTGKVPTSTALTWRDRISFLLCDTLQLKKLSFLDVVFEATKGDQQADAFDANMAIAMGELSQLIPELVDALGGEQVPGAGDAEAAKATGDESEPWA
jgi:recombination associated protein RdgC